MAAEDAKISDFGLARLLDGDRATTRTGTILGTPSYMAPEPALGVQADGVDRARWRIFLAMSQHHLGRSRAAQESYHRARSDRSVAKPSPAAAEEFARLWPEAGATLRVEAGTR